MTETVDRVFQDKIGHLEESFDAIINDILVTVIKPFNVYKERQLFGKEGIENSKSDFVNWLIKKDLVSVIDFDDYPQEEFTEILTSRYYYLFRFWPSYKNILWVSRINRKGLNDIPSFMVGFLAIYRDAFVKGVDITQLVIQRNVDKMVCFRDSMVEYHLQKVIEADPRLYE